MFTVNNYGQRECYEWREALLDGAQRVAKRCGLPKDRAVVRRVLYGYRAHVRVHHSDDPTPSEVKLFKKVEKVAEKVLSKLKPKRDRATESMLRWGSPEQRYF